MPETSKGPGNIFFKPIQAVALIGFALLIYWPSFHSEFHFDDLTSIIQNPYIRIADLKPGSLWQAAVQDRVQNRPLPNLSFALNFYLSQLNTFSYHVVNFILLVITGLGVWLLLEKLFIRLGYDRGRSGLAAWMAALVWTAHPLNTQAITYIVQRSTAMAGAFSVWSVYFYHLARQRKNPRSLFYVLAASFCLLAMLSKETAAVLPLIIFAYGLYFFDGFSQGWLRRNWKWIFALVILYLVAASLVLRPGMIEKGMDDFKQAGFSAWEKFLSAPRTMVWYFFLTIFPIPQFLSLVHDYPVSRSLFHPWTTALSFAIVLAMIALAVYNARRWKAFSFCVLWYFGNLLIEAMPLPIDPVNEHRLYLALLGIIAPLVAWLILKIKNYKSALVLLMAVSLFLGLFSWQRNRIWKTDESLWRDTLQKAPKVSRAWANYCSALIDSGNNKKDGPACKYAVFLDPDDPELQNNLALAYLGIENYDQAEIHLLKAVELKPDFAIALFNLGTVKILQGDLVMAKIYLRRAGELKTADARMYFNLGMIFQKLEDNEKALAEFLDALKLRPEWAQARLNAALILADQGKCPEAVLLLEAAPVADKSFEQIYSKCR